jgi:hypothetical protein
LIDNYHSSDAPVFVKKWAARVSVSGALRVNRQAFVRFGGYGVGVGAPPPELAVRVSEGTDAVTDFEKRRIRQN